MKSEIGSLRGKSAIIVISTKHIPEAKTTPTAQPLNKYKLEQWDADAYKCELGVFMRYLLRAYKQPNNPIKLLVDTLDYKACLYTTAQAACSVKQQDLFDKLNVLATLTTALQLLTI